jgi:L-fuconate dehydratase
VCSRTGARRPRGRPDIEEIFDEPVAFWRSLTADPQLRWIGPEKGVIRMATGAVVNAVWDLRAKLAGVPMWRLLAQMPADELVQCVDFHHISDALTPQEAHAILEEGSVGWGVRLAAHHVRFGAFPRSHGARVSRTERPTRR